MYICISMRTLRFKRGSVVLWVMYRVNLWLNWYRDGLITKSLEFESPPSLIYICLFLCRTYNWSYLHVYLQCFRICILGHLLESFSYIVSKIYIKCHIIMVIFFCDSAVLCNKDLFLFSSRITFLVMLCWIYLGNIWLCICSGIQQFWCQEINFRQLKAVWE